MVDALNEKVLKVYDNIKHLKFIEFYDLKVNFIKNFIGWSKLEQPDKRKITNFLYKKYNEKKSLKDY